MTDLAASALEAGAARPVARGARPGPRASRAVVRERRRRTDIIGRAEIGREFQRAKVKRGDRRCVEARAPAVGLGVLTLFAASVLIFIGTEMMPGDLASAILQNSATPESLAKLRLDLGLDQPAYIRYFEWLFGALHGDFGHSLANGRDVLTEIAPRFANTMFLAAYAAVVAVPLAVGSGCWRRSGRAECSTG